MLGKLIGGNKGEAPKIDGEIRARAANGPKLLEQEGLKIPELEVGEVSLMTLPETTLKRENLGEITIPPMQVASNYISEPQELRIADAPDEGVITFGYTPERTKQGRRRLKSKEGVPQQEALVQTYDVEGVGRVILIARPASDNYHRPQDAVGVQIAQRKLKNSIGQEVVQTTVAIAQADGVTNRPATIDEIKRNKKLIITGVDERGNPVIQSNGTIGVASDGDYFASRVAEHAGSLVYGHGAKIVANDIIPNPIRPAHREKNPRGGATLQMMTISTIDDGSKAINVEITAAGSKDNLGKGTSIYPVKGRNVGQPFVREYVNLPMKEERASKYYEQDVSDEGVFVEGYTPKMIRTSTGIADQVIGQGFQHPTVPFDQWYAWRDYTTPEYQQVGVNPEAYTAAYYDGGTFEQDGQVYFKPDAIKVGAYTDRYPISLTVMTSDGATLKAGHHTQLTLLTGDIKAVTEVAGSKAFLNSIIEDDNDDGTLVIFIPEEAITRKPKAAIAPEVVKPVIAESAPVAPAVVVTPIEIAPVEEPEAVAKVETNDALSETITRVITDVENAERNLQAMLDRVSETRSVLAQNRGYAEVVGRTLVELEAESEQLLLRRNAILTPFLRVGVESDTASDILVKLKGYTDGVTELMEAIRLKAIKIQETREEEERYTDLANLIEERLKGLETERTIESAEQLLGQAHRVATSGRDAHIGSAEMEADSLRTLNEIYSVANWRPALRFIISTFVAYPSIVASRPVSEILTHDNLKDFSAAELEKAIKVIMKALNVTEGEIENSSLLSKALDAFRGNKNLSKAQTREALSISITKGMGELLGEHMIEGSPTYALLERLLEQDEASEIKFEELATYQKLAKLSEEMNTISSRIGGIF